MLSLAIIADDLTGALDAAAPFAGLEGGVVVATHPGAIHTALGESPAVLAVSTRSRDLDSDKARLSVTKALAALPENTPLFKKVDSRLKGHIAAELSAFPNRLLLVAPAIPEFGRIVQNDLLQGFGIASAIPVRERLGRYGDSAIVPDIETETDFDTALSKTTQDTLLVGARGLAAALARRMGVPPLPVAPALPHPLCIAAGSSDPITLRQITELTQSSDQVLHVAAPSGIGPTTPASPLAPVTILQATTGEETPASTVAANFAHTARAWLDQSRSMILTGGATAEACLDTLGIETLRITGEPIAGMPVCTACGKSIVTKSGGFGAPDALVRLAGLNHTTEV